MSYPVLFRRGLPAVLLLCTVLPVCAQEAAPIVVTATRLPEAADATLSSVTVITRVDIERSQAASLPELLQARAGVSVATQGGSGKLTALYLRGTNPGQVTVLVDGIRMGSVTSGTVAWEFIPLAQIDRIEIARGPNSALYGSEAIGGVIQIFTRRGQGPLRWGASVSGGRYNTRSVSADASGSRDDNWFSARVSRDLTDGFNARRPTVEFGALINEPDKDGYANTAGSVRIGHRFHDGSELELHGFDAAGYTEYDSAFPYANEDDFVQQSLGLTLRTSPSQHSDLTFTLGRSLDNRTSFRAGQTAQTYRFDSERRVLSLQDDLYLTGTDTVSLGFDYHDDRVDSNTAYTVTSRGTSAVFVQYQKQLDRYSLLVRVRPLHDAQFGHYTTGNLALGYHFSPQLDVSLSWGNAYKAPTFNDLYYPPFLGYPTSNPNLRPETSATTELGLAGTHSGMDWDLRIYHTRIDQLIVLDSNFLPANLARARIDGIEAGVGTRWLGWNSKLSATWLDATDPQTGNQLPRRARTTLRIDTDREFGRAGLGATLIVQGGRYDDAANTRRVGGYGLLNLRSSWQLNRRLQLQGRIDNALDQHYELVDTYNTAGRSLFVSLHYESGA